MLNSEPAQFSLRVGVARGMAFLHDQKPTPILHYDFKSDNVLVWQEDYSPQLIANIADFGHATGTLASTIKTNQIGTGAATLVYKAPEAFDGDFNAANDVYSYGIIRREVLTGEAPWQGYAEASLTKAITKEARLPLPLDIAAAPLGRMV